MVRGSLAGNLFSFADGTSGHQQTVPLTSYLVEALASRINQNLLFEHEIRRNCDIVFDLARSVVHSPLGPVDLEFCLDR